MFVVRLLFVFTPFVCCFSYIQTVHNVVMNKKVAKLINNYIKPLSEKFPNHEFEVQIDFQGPPLRRFGPITRRNPYYRKPIGVGTNVVRDGDASDWKKIQSLNYMGEITRAKPSHQPTSTNPPTTSTATVLSPAPTARVEKHGPKKEEPVYKDELQKALDDLEKKINKNLKGSGGIQELRDQILVSNPGPVTGESHPNINRIIELIRRGVHFQRHVPNTDDGNLEWVQIKIPKNLSEIKSTR